MCRLHTSALGLVMFSVALGCGAERAESPLPQQTTSRRIVRLDTEHLPNAYQVHTKVISGGQPDGEAGFRELQKMGVRTVICVDGAKPQVELAKKFGLRYVHLPHGYDGVPQERGKELAKAVRDLPGMVYIHCHHGKHRSPAAAAVACVAAGLLPSNEAVAVLRTAGTSENYRGLYASAASAKLLDERLLNELQTEFPATATLPPLAEAMVSLERVHDDLKQVASNGWKATAQHPDLEPAHAALLLREHFAELLRVEEIKQRPERFQQLLRESEHASATLETHLRQWAAGGTAQPPEQVATAFAAISANCTVCHREFRNVPLKEPRTQ